MSSNSLVVVDQEFRNDNKFRQLIRQRIRTRTILLDVQVSKSCVLEYS